MVADAVRLFWRQGFEDTSVADLEQELSVNRSTLYASFDGKAGLYATAVDSYIESMEGRLVTPLRDGEAGLADLIGFVDRLQEVLTDPANPAGCLIVNAMGTGKPPQASDRYLASLRLGFDASLDRAAEAGEIDGTQRGAKAAAILTSVIGLNVMAKAGIDQDDLDRLFDGVRATIEGWRLPTS